MNLAFNVVRVSYTRGQGELTISMGYIQFDFQFGEENGGRLGGSDWGKPLPLLSDLLVHSLPEYLWRWQSGAG